MNDTIAAIATPPGRGGVGIIRLSGPRALVIGREISALPSEPLPRHAHYTAFVDETGLALDEGLLIYFRAPHSFTGEDVVELQGHGGPIVLDMLLQRTLKLGARLARPGEFSERAFLNDRLDLAQAEAIADLIEAGSEQAARSALHSLQGAFSARVNDLLEVLITLRLHVEAAIDFPEEEIDFLADGVILEQCRGVIAALDEVLSEARQGVLLSEGMRVVIAGRPNAGKSSLLNQLAGDEVAIVTDIAGTTRDVLRQHIQIDGMPLHVIDTAGLRDSPDVVEQEGIRRARAEIDRADRMLFMWDASDPSEDPALSLRQFFDPLPERITLIANKCDRTELSAGLGSRKIAGREFPCVVISAREGLGLQALREHLKQQMGYQAQAGGSFSARRRHLAALTRSRESVVAEEHEWSVSGAGELASEDLRLAQIL
ncbi:MAG: tRNA uridine-5-carboxymethylaminomethyl(34) synthesis GTPase MnmE, partial [Perlucidibaca sp.]